MNFLEILKLFKALYDAGMAIHNSAPGQAGESILWAIIKHLTPGEPNHPALDPAAPPPVGNEGGTEAS